MEIILTGGAGFIGSHLIDALLANGHRVHCVDDLSKGTLSNIEHNRDNPALTFHQVDVTQPGALREISATCDAVVHLASTKIPRYESGYRNLTMNVAGTREALEMARERNAKFVFASTSDVYGKSPEIPFNEDGNIFLGPSTSRRWTYALTKLYGEHLAFSYQDEFEVPITILRFFGTYGERQYLDWWGGPQGVFLKAVSSGEPLQIHGDGIQTRCFIYITDLAQAAARAIERPEAVGEILNVGTDEEVSIGDLAHLLYRLSGKEGDPPIEYVPYTSFSQNYEDVRRRVPDLSKMERILEFMPTVSLEEGSRRLWAWYRALEPAAHR